AVQVLQPRAPPPSRSDLTSLNTRALGSVSRVQLVPISDGDDPRIVDYRGLTDVNLRRALEPAGGLYLAESPKVIARALEAGHTPRSVLLSPKWVDALAPLIGDRHVPIYVADSSILDSITGFPMHRGAIASMHRPELPEPGELLRKARTVVVLEDIADHTNV